MKTPLQLALEAVSEMNEEDARLEYDLETGRAVVVEGLTFMTEKGRTNETLH